MQTDNYIFEEVLGKISKMRLIGLQHISRFKNQAQRLDSRGFLL